MERKYIMQLPRGAKVSSTDIKYEDGKIVLTAQLEEWKPEDGEVCYVRDIQGYESVFIKRDDGCNITSHYVSFDNHKTFYCNPGVVTYNKVVDVLRPATDKEKQQLFDALAKQNMRWNPEKKIVENMRWRAKPGEDYYYISGLPDKTPEVSFRQETCSAQDDMDYNRGNYFKTKEAALIAGNQMIDILKNSKAE